MDQYDGQSSQNKNPLIGADFSPSPVVKDSGDDYRAILPK